MARSEARLTRCLLNVLLSQPMSLNPVLRRAIQRAPCSVRALARTAGVSHVMLAQIVRGKEAATERVAVKVARALETLGIRCQTEAARIRVAVRRRTNKKEGV